MSSLPLLLALLWLTAGPLRAQELDDPTRPVMAPAPAATGEGPPPDPAAQATPQLTSILIGPRRRVAVIDGRVLTRGQQIRGARITAIEADRVELDRDGQRLTLTLTLPAIKASPKGEEAP